MQFLSVINLFALDNSCSRLQAVPITAASGMVFLLFFFALLIEWYEFHTRHLNVYINLVNQNLLI